MHCPPCGYEKVTASRGLNVVNSGSLFSAHGYIYCKRLYFYQYSWSHFQNILNCRCSCMIQQCCYSKRCHDIYDYFPHIRQHLGEVGRKPSVTIKAYFILTYIHYHQCTIYIAGTKPAAHHTVQMFPVIPARTWQSAVSVLIHPGNTESRKSLA